MARVVSAIEKYAREVVPELGEHPLLGRPSISLGRISGGISVNVVPDRCAIEVDRRLVPGEDPHGAWEHATSYLRNSLGEDINLQPEEPFQALPAMDPNLNESLAKRVARATRECGGSGQQIGVPYGTDAPAFLAVGIPTVVFGPGDIQQAHTVDEWVEISQLQAAADSYYQLAATWRERMQD
jgi:acetylornithine deacetylase